MHISVMPRRARSRFFSTPLTIAYTFLGLNAIGTLLLMLPFTHYGSASPLFLTALFTATSAVTDTALVVEDTASFWTFYGKIVILALMYVGGLGFMTLATFGLVIIGQRITISQRLLAREFLSVNQLGGLVRLAIGVVIVATAIQVAGLILLAIRFSAAYSWPQAIWQGAFHSVSAFNSAGFNILNEPEKLVAYQRDPMVLGIMTTLIFIGAISYLVIIDVARYRWFSRYTLNTKLVLALTALMIPVAAGSFLLVEYSNPTTLGPLSVQEKVVGSVFHGVSNRTAGFNIIDFSATNEGTQFLTTAFMFVGGASASVTGGIKVNTLAIILVAVLAAANGRSNPRAFGREVPWEQVRRALVIGLTAAVFV
ncbi:MAG: potassium transporter TrkG, partial [Ardenticatenaceae bacterium]